MDLYRLVGDIKFISSLGYKLDNDEMFYIFFINNIKMKFFIANRNLKIE